MGFAFSFRLNLEVLSRSFSYSLKSSFVYLPPVCKKKGSINAEFKYKEDALSEPTERSSSDGKLTSVQFYNWNKHLRPSGQQRLP